MVGAIADWFAVVALFRHPLGLPIPHTAIIPSNKDRIGENLATFICANFLSTEQVLRQAGAFDPARSASPPGSPAPAHAERAGGAPGGGRCATALGVLDDDRGARASSTRRWWRASSGST